MVLKNNASYKKVKQSKSLKSHIKHNNNVHKMITFNKLYIHT